MFGKVSRAKDYACIEVEGSRDPKRHFLNTEIAGDKYTYQMTLTTILKL